MNKEEFKKLKEKAEKSGVNCASTQYNLGYAYYDGNGVTKNYKQAVGWFRKAAWNGHEYAHFYLARCYKDGTGVEKDLKQAAQHFKCAARNGDSTALSNLGLCYLNGDGVRKNLKKAKELFKRAREALIKPERRSCSCCYCRRHG